MKCDTRVTVLFSSSINVRIVNDVDRDKDFTRNSAKNRDDTNTLLQYLRLLTTSEKLYKIIN